MTSSEIRKKAELYFKELPNNKFISADNASYLLQGYEAGYAQALKDHQNDD